MDFVVFDKLSELETKVYLLEQELQEKDATICTLSARIKELEEYISKSSASNETAVNSDLCCLEPGKSVADILKETSESVLRSTAYAFNERTGLYFDKNSGYYYEPKNQLFYEPKSGTYYRYNTETREYVLQSAVDEVLAAQFKHVAQERLLDDEQTHWDHVQNRNDDFRKSPIGVSCRRKRSRHESTGRRSLSPSPFRTSRYHSRSSSRSPHRRKHAHRRRAHGRRRSRSASDNSSNNDDPRSIRSRVHRKRRNQRRSTSRNRGDNRDRFLNDPRGSSAESEAQSKPTSLAAQPVVYPPVIRLMLLTSDHAPIGTVFIITSEESSKGHAVIGSSSAMCPTVHFPGDPAVDPIHCEIVYDEEDHQYALLDRNSESGTYLNGRILAQKAQIVLHHGDVIRVGSSRLLVHIHEGHECCGQCDPETVRMAMQAAEIPTVSANQGVAENGADPTEPVQPEDATDQGSVFLTAAELRELKRRATLDQLKEQYGLKHRIPVSNTNTETVYRDRAAQRRAIEKNLKAAGYVSPERAKRVPLIACEHPATPDPPPASVPLNEENRGAKLLSKMGWNPGQGLGKDNHGIVEPISVSQRSKPLAGLGYADNSSRGYVGHTRPR